MLSPGHLDTRAELAKHIDYTLLKPTAVTAEFDRLCDEAVRYGFWSVCVPPAQVKHAFARLRRTNVKVCTVIGFPLGYNTTEVKLFEARKAVADGAVELDMVSDFGALKSGDLQAFSFDVEAVAGFCKSSRTILKVILECCYLTNDEKVNGAKIAESAGADFVKTSTGFGTGGATLEDVALLRRVLARQTRVKAAGGIATLAQALDLVRAGADRLGTSHGGKIIEELPQSF